LGEGSWRTHTALPGAEQERIEPVFGTWAVMLAPESSVTSARNRL
jgi:hypothetical protein